MFCEPCGSERLGTARFCVLCGSTLELRAREHVEADLSHVRWILGEMPRWESASIGEKPRAYLTARYQQMEHVLLSALTGSPPKLSKATAEQLTHHATPPETPPVEFVSDESPAALPPAAKPEEFTSAAPVASGKTLAVPPQAAASARVEPAPGAEVEARVPRARRVDADDFAPPAPSAEDRVVEAASSWQSVWKPFLNESVGWFIGGFLILAGTFYFVADAWGEMTSTTRALVVFGLAAAWSLGFAAWAQFLSRREKTEAASRILKLIAAAMAPLAGVALGPVVGDHLWTLGPVALWAGMTAWFSRGVQRSQDPHGPPSVIPAAMAVTTFSLAAAPLLAPLGEGAHWLGLIPLGLVWASARADRTEESPRLFAFVAPLYLAGLTLIRLHLALVAAGHPAQAGTWAPFGVLLALAALEIRRPSKRAADFASVASASVMAVLVCVSATGSAPAFFLSSLLATVGCVRLARGNSAGFGRWHVGTYVFGHLAWQSCAQVIPQALRDSLGTWIAGQLGHQSLESVPHSYDAVYAAVWVLAAGVLASRWLGARSLARRALATTWLSTTLWASLAVGAFSMLSLEHDALPSVVSLPVLAVLCLALGFLHDRPGFTRAGALLSASSAVAFAVWHGAGATGAVAGALALGLSALSVFALKGHRAALALGAGAAAAVSIALAWVAPDAFGGLGLVLSAAALWVSARNLNHRPAVRLSLLVALTIPAWLCFAFVTREPRSLALVLAFTALAAAGLSWLDSPSKWFDFADLSPGSALLGLAAVVMATELPYRSPGLTALLVAVALLGARKTHALFHAAGLVLLPLAFVGRGSLCTTFDGDWAFQQAAVAAAVLALGASVWAEWKGRSWRPALLASGAVLLALASGGISAFASNPTGCVLAAVAVLLATRALLPWLTVPLAGLLLGAAKFPEGVELALAFSFAGFALLEEFDLTWKRALGRMQISWPAALVSLGFVLHVALDGATPAGTVPWLLAAVVALPLLWLRATRSPLIGLVWAPLFALVAHQAHSEVLALCVPVSAVLFTRLLAQVPAVRQVLLGTAASDAAVSQAVHLTLLGIGVTGLVQVTAGQSAAPYALALLLGAGELLPVRIIAAAAFALMSPLWVVPLAFAFLGLAFAARHLPKATHGLLGSTPQGWSVMSFALASIALGAWALVMTPFPNASIVLALLCAGAAVVLGWRWLLAAAGLAAAYPASVFDDERVLLVALALAGLAAALRWPAVELRVREVLSKAGAGFAASLALPLWTASMLLAVALLTVAHGVPAPWVLLLGALLLVTLDPVEGIAALVLGAALVVTRVERPAAAMVLEGLGLGLTLLSARLFAGRAISRVWKHAGWVFALGGVGALTALGDVSTPVSFGLAAVTLWFAAQSGPARWLRWVPVLVASHAVLAFVGVSLSTGAPHELILPWVAVASMAVGLCAVSAKDSGSRALGFVVVGFGFLELLAALVVLPAHPREALAVLCGLSAVAGILGHKAWKEDHGLAAGFALLTPVFGFLTLRGLGAGHGPDGVEAFAGLLGGVMATGLGRLLFDQEKTRVAKVARLFSTGLPLFGLCAAFRFDASAWAGLLLGLSLHFAISARWSRSAKRRSSVASALAFNAAMVALAFGAHLSAWEYLLAPVGLSALVLVKLFEADLAGAAAGRIRAVAVTLLYAAAAWKPLTFSAPWALWVCVAVCVLGVGAGIALRVRSYVFLGTAFLVTSVLANLIRYGVREPRIGALFLSALGLLVVGFMVLLTTRRAELLQRYAGVQRMLAQWDA